MADNILEVKGLKKYFNTPHGLLHAVDDVSFSIEEGKTLGVVGESGCGKSTLGRVILRLLKSTEGEVLFEGKDILKYSKAEMRAMRKSMQIIFQDPYESINPRMSIGELIAEPLIVNKICKGAEMDKKIRELMDTVGLAERLINSYPHELDGGRRQRIGIARALSVSPKFIVCDEPVSALDVSIQAQILNLMQDLQKERGFTYMFISHNLSVVKHISDDIMVMYLGKMVEKAPKNELFKNPLHPYTRALLEAIPIPKLSSRDRQREILQGEIKSPINPKDECRFAGRCKYASEQCRSGAPELREITPGHFVSCFCADK
ncbi:MAG: ATP-binding cassette domain-containing protein [Clostridia bacterium]|nr:ATP-binding cassette domain-containing protein [Clostridia bacterium]